MSKVCEILKSVYFNSLCSKSGNDSFCCICIKTQLIEDAIGELQLVLLNQRSFPNG